MELKGLGRRACAGRAILAARLAARIVASRRVVSFITASSCPGFDHRTTPSPTTTAKHGSPVIWAVAWVEPPNTGDPLRGWRELDVDGTRPWFRSLARNKKSVSIDMRKDEGRALVRRLAERSDVERWGLGPDKLRATNPGLIFTGYGQTGPWSSRPGYASVCEAEAGFRFINGFPDGKTGELSGPHISLGDSVAGLTAAFARTTCQGRSRHRRRNDMSIMERVSSPEFDRKAVVRSPSGSSVTGIVPTGAYPCTPAPGSPPDYRSRRTARRVEIEDAIVAWTSARTRDDVLRALDPDRGACRARRERACVRDIVTNEQVRERGAVESVWVPGQAHSTADESGWTVKMPGVAPRLEGGRTGSRSS
ncbi:CoA-transferase family III domain-containing protein [Lactarius pseudohatsudake]|nr:CoA-transferase family III domain-containing protein [Lactarius pseudohatsudake]